MDSSWSVSLLNLLKTRPEILISIASFFVLYFYRVNRNSVLPINWPVIGMLPTMVSHLHDLHDYGVKVLGANRLSFMFKGPWFTGMDMFMTCDPANVNHVFNTHFSSYVKGEEFKEIFDIFGESLLTTDGEKWRWQRKMLHALITNRSFRTYELNVSRDKVENGLIPILNRAAEEKKVIDLEDLFMRLTFDTICNMVVGVDPGCLSYDLPTHTFAKAVDDASDIIFNRHLVPRAWWKTLRWLRVGSERRLAIAGAKMHHFIEQTITERREHINKQKHDGDGKEESIPRSDLLTTFTTQFEESGNKTDFERKEFDNFLHANAKNLLLAGRDTTGAATAWFVWLLSQHPHVERKIVQELRANWPRMEETSPNKNTPFDHEGLAKLVYLHAALLECLRLYPTVALQRKSAVKTTTLPSGHIVHPGTIIIFHLYSMGRMESIWGKDCMEFKPERWFTESGELKHEPSYKFFSFNSGPRTCVGKDISIHKMKTIVAALLYNFHIEVAEGHVVEPMLSIVLRMKHGLKVRITKKDKSGW
ncbi:alkane hydroxylase MAH1-like [Typha angustifolia]|uniref:alkane hydroxylase MAH1-like n=1 Tax=Typha angustifolia TaxID=59011 RepID=UPI003C309E20